MSDLIHAFKGLVHSWNGRTKQALAEYRKIQDPINLPEWDDVDFYQKIEVYTTGWKQLREEGYDDNSGNVANLLGNNEPGA